MLDWILWTLLKCNKIIYVIRRYFVKHTSREIRLMLTFTDKDFLYVPPGSICRNSVFCTKGTYLFCVDLRINSDYFSILHNLLVSINECLVRGTKCAFISDSYSFVLKGIVWWWPACREHVDICSPRLTSETSYRLRWFLRLVYSRFSAELHVRSEGNILRSVPAEALCWSKTS